MDNTSPSGFIAVAGSSTHGPMYSHGFGTLFLAEAYGMTHRPEIREKLQKAVRLIIDSQNIEGGWRYQPVQARRRPVGDDLPDQRAAGGAERGAVCAQGDGRRVHPLCEAVAEPRRRFPLHAPGGPEQRISRGRRPAWWRCRAPGNTTRRRSATGSPICASSARACGSAGATIITSTASTTRPRPCGSRAGKPGRNGIRPVRDELLERQSAAGLLARHASATSTAPPWRSSSSRSRTITCRSFNDEGKCMAPMIGLFLILGSGTAIMPRDRGGLGSLTSLAWPTSADRRVGLAGLLRSRLQGAPDRWSNGISGRIVSLDPDAITTGDRRGCEEGIAAARSPGQADARGPATASPAWEDSQAVILPDGDRLMRVGRRRRRPTRAWRSGPRRWASWRSRSIASWA